MINFINLAPFDIRDLVIGKIVLEATPSNNDWKLSQDVLIGWTRGTDHQRITLPAGLNTDLASVPRALWPMIPPHQLIKRPAVMHDGLYQLRPELVMTGATYRITRGEADFLLYLGCIGEGMSHECAEQVYLAVRVGGSNIWHSHDGDF